MRRRVLTQYPYCLLPADFSRLLGARSRARSARTSTGSGAACVKFQPHLAEYFSMTDGLSIL